MNGNESQHSNYMDFTTESENERKLDRPPRNFGKKENLRSILELPTKYQCVFEFPYFNIIQSHILDDVLYSDVPFVLSAPTGSGKTVVFECAVIRLLMNFEKTRFSGDYKIIYVAPVKALCSERLSDWHSKFSKIGLSCIVITGDSDNVTYKMLQKYQLIITTPEKWDSLTRNAQDNPIIQEVKLFMIDEVHLLNEETRGPILEAIVSRMKIFRKHEPIRFIAVSATIPNIEDIADWLGNSGGEPAVYFKIGEELRPVKLKKVVLGYSCKQGTPAFKFDINLNYKLQSIIMQYSEGKPTLIFCSTRKGVELTAKHISQEITFHLTADQKNILRNCAQKMLDNKMKSQLINGVGSHHAGMAVENRILIEDIFRAGHLPVLATTSTLAMGVNLPAHLVIIKSTERYVQGEMQNYTDGNLLQMIGRAGRPQFDTHATVVIMTKLWQKEHYEKFLCGTELIESNLHRHLTQHLNAEVVLGVITDIAIALEWIRHTFLYVRALKNPKYYNIAAETKDKIEKRLQDICQIEINALHRYGMLQIDQLDGFSVSPTNTGNLMAKYYLHLDTMKLFAQVTGHETLPEMLTLITKCKEFSETLLRTNDKKTLNTLNKCKYQNTIRFPLAGTIKTTEMKVNCIIQAILGCLKIQNPSLLQESWRIMKTGKSIANCLVVFLRNKEKCFSALHNALILSQCFNTNLWENSPYVSRQLPKIGPVLSSMLATAGKTTFKAILETNPRNLEMIINRGPPMGNEIQELITSLPFYSIDLVPPETNKTFNVKLVLTLLNADSINTNGTLGIGSFMTVLVGDTENNILLDKKIFHNTMVTCKEYVHYIEVGIQKNHIISAYLISPNWVGIDAKKTVEIKISNSIRSNSKYHSPNISPKEITAPAKIIEKSQEKTTNSCPITSYFKQVKTLPPNISSNVKKFVPQVKKTSDGVKKNGMKSITTYFSKQNKPGNIERPKKQFSFRSNYDQQNGQSGNKKLNEQMLSPVQNRSVFPESTLMTSSVESGYGTYGSLQPALDDHNLSKVSNFYPANIADIFLDSSIRESTQIDMTPTRNNTLSQVSNYYPSNIADIFKNVDDSIYCGNSQINMTPNHNNKFSQVSNYYPSNIADIFKNVDDSTYCESSQINMTPNKSNSQSNTINSNETLTQIPTQKKENSLTKFLKNTASQKQKLTSHISSRNFLSSLKQSVKTEPKKQGHELLSQFTYTARNKIDHTKIKKPRVLEYSSNISESDSDKELNNCDQEFYGKQKHTPNNIEKNKDELINEKESTPTEEEEIVGIPKLADSFRDYVMKTVQKLKAETLVNDEYDFDIGFEEFLLKPLNESYSDSSYSSEDEEVIKDNITASIPQTKLIIEGQKNEESPPPNIISSASFNTTNHFDVDQMLDNSLYKDHSFAKLNESTNNPQTLPSISFNITKNFDFDSPFYKNIDKLNDQTINDSKYNNNSFPSLIDLTFLPERDLQNPANAMIDNNFTFFPAFESPSHDLSFPNNFDSEEFKNMECFENSTDNSDNEVKRNFDSKFKIIEQWNSAHGNLYNEKASDITFDLSSRKPIKKIKLANASNSTKTTRKDEQDFPPYDVFQNLQPFNKLISNYNSQYKNRIILSNKDTRDYESDISQQSAIVERSSYSFCCQDNDTIEMSVTVIEKEQKVSATNPKFIHNPFLEPFQNDREKKRKKSISNRHPYYNPYFKD